MSKAGKRTPLPIWIAAGLFSLICASLIAYRPDRPIPRIEAGSSSVPTFAVQLIRPRTALPMGGLLPPQLFGLEGHLGFDSSTQDASVRHFGSEGLVLAARDWELKLLLDDAGRPTAESEIVFELVFQDELRKLRCRPNDPPIGEFTMNALADSDERAGHFDIEFARSEDARTGDPLAWPAEPFVVRGSFDRLRATDGSRSR